ncbi:MAG TPA: histidine kinase [Phenylobacterium sp.]|jgi:signal transduction histidine kinase|uniref:sensor histidine kinase n=1 Tax=Phenylobacterium sp. TaxID=1871053 RepID=UPI002D5CB868|nr:histidine kinase [Phenylobacterium sp.]HZZ67310.1 histidine kinase [Phenylobacterium sp.]
MPRRAPFDGFRLLVRASCGLMLAAGGAEALLTWLIHPQTFAAHPHWNQQWPLAYGVLVLSYVAAELDPRPGLTPRRAALFFLEGFAAQYLVWLYPSFLVTSMIVVVAWQVAWTVSLRGALLAAAALCGALVAQKCAVGGQGMSAVILISSCGFQLFAIGAAHLARREAAARERLAQANAELAATQALLTQSARMGERLRISRDLHDALGHNLTSLHVHLDVATRLAEGPAAAHLAQARGIAGDLLGEVRKVVRQIRMDPVDLRATLMTLADSATGLEVRLDLPDELGALDAARADALLRCVQELITNSLRHAAARRLTIRVDQAADGAIVLSAQDDGQGSNDAQGQGLTGMRERFEALGGRLSVFSRSGEGFRVTGSIPPVGLPP